MRLIYRGNQYNYNPQSLSGTHFQAVGRYRGWPSQRPIFAQIPSAELAPMLCYRGVTYQAQGAVSWRATAAPAVPIPVFSATYHNRQTPTEVDQVHLAFMRQTLEYRLNQARAKGDPNLVATLEAEQTQLRKRW